MSEPILLSEWLEISDCPRSTAYELIKLAGIEPGKVRVPSSRRPVSELSAEQREQLEWLWSQRKAGTSKEELARQIAQAQGDGLGLSAEGLRMSPDGAPLGLSDPQQMVLSNVVEHVTTRAIGVALANVRPPRSTPDPLRRAKFLAEASQLEWLTKAEIATVLGVSQKSVDDLSWPHTPRPGYRIERENFERETWFRVVCISK